MDRTSTLILTLTLTPKLTPTLQQTLTLTLTLTLTETDTDAGTVTEGVAEGGAGEEQDPDGVGREAPGAPPQHEADHQVAPYSTANTLESNLI